MPRHRVRLCLSCAVLVIAIGLAAACSGSVTTASVNASPTSPSAAASAPAARLSVSGESPGPSAKDPALFALPNGTFTFTTATGDRLIGTFVGDVAVPIPGRPTATLQLQVTGGTGVFQGATGTLEGQGGGAFSGEGDFVLVSSGVIFTTTTPAGTMFRATVVGTSTLSCSAAGRIIVTQLGHGTVATMGRIDGELSSEISNTACHA